MSIIGSLPHPRICKHRRRRAIARNLRHRGGTINPSDAISPRNRLPGQQERSAKSAEGDESEEV
jgi:hypothetical protein